MKKGDRLLNKILWIFLALLCSPAIAFGQPQSDASSASNFAGIEQLRLLCKKTHQDQNCPSDQ